MGTPTKKLPAKSELPADWLEQLKAAYPRRGGGQGWTAVKRLVPAHVARGESFESIIEGTRRYARWCEATGKVRTELVKMAQTFYGRDKWWQEDYELPVTDADHGNCRRGIQEWLDGG